MTRAPLALLPVLLLTGLLPAVDPAPQSVAPHLNATWRAGFARAVITPDKPLWMAGYSNDYSGYIPSLRLQREGGYEAATGWAEDAETRIVRKVHELHAQLP